VSTAPGSTVVTPRPSLATSERRLAAKARTPALVAAYTASSATPTVAMEETNTRCPRPRDRIPPTATLASCIGAVRFSATSADTSSPAIVASSPANPHPALFTSRSASAAAALARDSPAGVARSATIALPPVRRTTWSSRVESRPRSTRRQPAAAR
jgi:hypothetical protein